MLVLRRTTRLICLLSEPKGSQPFSLFARGFQVAFVLVSRLLPFVVVPLQLFEFGLCFGSL